MSDYELTDRQKDIVEGLLEGSLFVAAGAGSGKTTVVMEGFVEALSQKKAAIDEILTITFTDKAAGDMMRKVREILKDKGMLAERRQIENARISTIHSFCARLIRSHALLLGLDPGFGVADANRAGVLKQEAFDTCLESLVADHGEEAAELIFLLDRNRSGLLFGHVTGLHEKLRSQNRPLDFTLPEVDLASLLEQLARAARDALRALDAKGSSSASNRQKLEQLEALPGVADPVYIRELLAANKVSNFRGAPDEVADVNALWGLCRSATYLPLLKLLRELLVRFGGEYARLKREAGLLDFEDLQIEALRLLNEQPEVAERVAGQFRYIIVDEFQDTNHLQCEIVDRLDRGNVCFVGDENQSIYRFRNAEVELFQQKRREADEKTRLKELAENFRSQPEILEFVDLIFSREGMLDKGGYLSLIPRAKPDPFSEESRVEVMLVDHGGKEKPNADLARQGEAELIARRLQELFKEGCGYEPGKTAILVRSRTGLDKYREALDRYGIPNYLGINKDYYRKLELGDALNLLKLLVNPLDDLALIAVLRSPMVGVSDETLMQLRQAVGRGWVPLWPVLDQPDRLDSLDKEEHRRLEGFRDEFNSLRRRSRGQQLTATVREVLGFRDYSAVAARDRKGGQALANLLKLQDLAAAFESSWGPDLGAFVEFLQEQQESKVDEADAPTEEEGGGAVRFLTIHKSKGLEFDLVVWPNMGGRPPGDGSIVLFGDEGQVGFSFKDANGKDVALFDYEKIQEESKAKELAEEKRLGYVAMTRARRRLILCGRTDLDKAAAAPAASCEPVDWVKGALGLHSANEDLAELFARPEPSRRMLLKGVEKAPPVLFTICTDPEALLEEGQKLAAARAAEAVEDIDPDISTLPAGAVFVPPYISPTALDAYKTCPRQYYLERVLKLGDLNGMVAPVKRAGGNGLDAAQRGTLAHALLEEASFPLGEPPGESQLLELAGRVLEPGFQFSDEDREHIHRYLGNLAEAPVMADLVEAEKQGCLEREKQFTYLLGETIISGKMDAFARLDGQVVVVDYKTTKLSEEFDNEAAAAKYRRQMEAYAVAAGQLAPGLPLKVCLLFLDQPGAEQTRVYQAADLDRLKAELGGIIESMADGAFEPLPAFDRDCCVFCIGGPNRTRLCPVANGGRK